MLVHSLDLLLFLVLYLNVDATLLQAVYILLCELK